MVIFWHIYRYMFTWCNHMELQPSTSDKWVVYYIAYMVILGGSNPFFSACLKEFEYLVAYLCCRKKCDLNCPVNLTFSCCLIIKLTKTTCTTQIVKDDILGIKIQQQSTTKEMDGSCQLKISLFILLNDQARIRSKILWMCFSQSFLKMVK